MPAARKPVKMGIAQAATEWGIACVTLRKRLLAQEITPDNRRHYTIRQIDSAVHGDKEGEDLMLVRAKRESQEMANEKEAGNLVDLAEYRRHSAKQIIAAKQFILSRTWMTQEHKDEILNGIADTFIIEHPDPVKQLPQNRESVS